MNRTIIKGLCITGLILSLLKGMAVAAQHPPSSICAEAQYLLDKLVTKTDGEFPNVLCIPTTEVANELEPGVLLMIKGNSQIFSAPDLNAKQYMTLAITAASVAFKNSKIKGLKIHVTDRWLQERGEYFSMSASDAQKLSLRRGKVDAATLFKKVIAAGKIQKFPLIDFKEPEKTAGKIGIVGSQEDIDDFSKKSEDVKVKGFSHPE